MIILSFDQRWNKMDVKKYTPLSKIWFFDTQVFLTPTFLDVLYCFSLVLEVYLECYIFNTFYCIVKAIYLWQMQRVKRSNISPYVSIRKYTMVHCHCTMVHCQCTMVHCQCTMVHCQCTMVLFLMG